MNFITLNRIVTVVLASLSLALRATNHPEFSYEIAALLVGWMWSGNWHDKGRFSE